MIFKKENPSLATLSKASYRDIKYILQDTYKHMLDILMELSCLFIVIWILHRPTLTLLTQESESTAVGSHIPCGTLNYLLHTP